MTPGVPLVKAANLALSEEDKREEIKRMHDQKYSLIQMVETLQLDDELTPELRQIIQAIPEDVVEQIRQATLDMLERGGNYTMPVECAAKSPDPSPPLDVTVETVNSQKTLIVKVPSS